MHQKRKELIELAKRRNDRDPAVQAALDGLKAQVKADLKRQRGAAMAPAGDERGRSSTAGQATGPYVARFLAIAAKHVAGMPQRRPEKGEEEQEEEEEEDGAEEPE